MRTPALLWTSMLVVMVLAACGPVSSAVVPGSSRPRPAPAAFPSLPGAPATRGPIQAAEPAPDQPLGLRFPAPPVGLQSLVVPPGDRRGVSFTFDDGPSAEFTPQILALLAAAHATATFCLIGRDAVRLPVLVQAEVRGRFALCDHSRDHDLRMTRRNGLYQRDEVVDGLRDIQSVDLGAPVAYYRQPGGFWDADVVSAMYGAGLDPLRWSDDPRDWSRPGMVAIVQRVLLRLRPGAVILLHDGGGDRSETVSALAWLLPRLQHSGWRFTLPVARPLPLREAETVQ